MNKLLLAGALASSVLLAGCYAQTDQTAISAQASTAAAAPISINAQGETLGFKVTDARASNVIGQRQGSAALAGGKIIPSNDIALLVQKALVPVISNYNFKPTTYASNLPVLLNIKVLNLNFVEQLSGRADLHAVIEAVATKQGKTFVHIYHGDASVDRGFFGLSEGAVNQQISVVLSNAISHVASSKALWQFLVN